MKCFWWLLASVSFLLVVSCDGENTTKDHDVDYTITGFVQKGPFVKNSQIDIQELDAALAPTGKSYNTQTEDDLGGFDLPSTLTSRYAEIKASGYYFNEITGDVSASTLTFNVLADLSLGEKTNVNILTTLARPRIKYLMEHEEKNFTEARVQAEAEVLKAFYIEEEGVSSFQEMDISRQGTSNAILLAISAILQAGNTEGKLSQLLGDLMDDLEEDGTIDDAGIKEEIAANAQYVGTMLATIRTNIEAYYAELDTTVTVPPFEDFCDDDGDTVINKYDFTVVFTPVTGADLAAVYTSDEITVVLPPYAETANATVTGGTLVVNGVDLGETATELVTGDLVAVKVTAASELDTTAEGVLSVTYDGIYRPDQENKGTFSVTTRVEPYFATDQTLEQWPGVTVQSEPATVSLPTDLENADIAITEGMLLINDTESGQSGTVKNGDTVAVRLMTGPTHGDEVTSTITISHDTFTIGEGIVVAQTNRTKLSCTDLEAFGKSVAVDNHGNTFVAGYTFVPLDGNTYLGGGDIFLTKWALDGTKAWTKQWGTAKGENGSAAAVDDDGNMFVTGSTDGSLDGNTNPSTANDIFLTKWTPDGIKAWTKQWGSSGQDNGSALAVDGDGNIFVVGETADALDGNTAMGGWDIFLTKWNTDGTKAWTKQSGTASGNSAEGVAINSNGDIFVTGNTQGALDGNTSSGGYDIFLTKWSTDGTKSWTKQWGTSFDDYGYSLAVDSDGNIFVAGITEGALDGNISMGSCDLFLTKWDADGTKVWTRQWGTSVCDEGASVAVDGAGNIFVTGSTEGALDGNTPAGHYDLFLTKWDTGGTKAWTKQWGTPGADSGYSVAVDNTGDIFVTGFTSQSLDGNLCDNGGIFLTKFSAE
ncbi:MAG TPA: SBBP repeat-containing protein [bacterium]|nr:SBBP repeat-containing protein [bacterium]